MAINLLGRQAVFGLGDEEIEQDAGKLDIPIHAFDLVVADECHRGYTAQEVSVYYNARRLHSRNRYRSPNETESDWRSRGLAASPPRCPRNRGKLRLAPGGTEMIRRRGNVRVAGL
jgi:hypothetical protein